MHLTLRFLGERDVAEVPAIADAITSLATFDGSGPFEMELDRLGCFGGPRMILDRFHS